MTVGGGAVGGRRSAFFFSKESSVNEKSVEDLSVSSMDVRNRLKGKGVFWLGFFAMPSQAEVSTKRREFAQPIRELSLIAERLLLPGDLLSGVDL